MLRTLYRYFIFKTRAIGRNRLINALEALPFDCCITFIDVGAAGGIEPRWKVVEKYLNYIGFEPDERSRVDLINKKSFTKKNTILPYALSDMNSDLSLNLCKNPKVSSTFNPNFSFLNLFPFADRFQILKSIFMPSKRLDELHIQSSNFIKLDIQGGELNALIGASQTLSHTLGIELEVEFTNLYCDQPLFGDLCKYLKSHDIEFIDFVGLCRWERDEFNNFGQCVFGDALFLRTPESLLNASHKPFENLDLVCSYLSILLIYQRFDLIHKTIEVISINHNLQFNKFTKLIKPLEKNFYRMRKICLFFDRLLNFYTNSNTKIHILY
jgi:FkbM family methyltransferase